MRDARRKRRTVAEYGPEPVDVHVGIRVRLRRTLLGMSQERIAEALGLTFQQVQKYEKGTNRISASRLYQLSLIFGVSVAYFFEELVEEGSASSPDDVMLSRETLELVKAYYRIRDPGVRATLHAMIKAMGKRAGNL